MIILAIESSCDETAAAVSRNGREILSDVVYSQADMHALYGGVVPEIASRQHAEKVSLVAEEALRQAGIGRADIDAVAATCAPGLIGALLVGANFAKACALALDVPFIPVHHIRGHIAACYVADPALEPPFTALVASGGHTVVIDVQDYTRMEVLGASRDDAAGEAFDKIARVLSLPYPGGAALDRLAQGGDPGRYRLPRAGVHGAPFDFSFSGLKTAAVNLVHNTAQKGETVDRAALAAGVCQAVADSIVPRVIEAALRRGRRPWLPRAVWPPIRSCARSSSARAAKTVCRCACRPCGCAGTTARWSPRRPITNIWRAISAPVPRTAMQRCRPASS